MNIQPPLLLSKWIRTALSLKKAERRRERRRGDRDDNERRRGAM
jgi:hypothetical protein